nr:hypothetical protein [Tanacetum cinerariifolium]
MICEICNHRVMNLRVMHSPTFRFIRVWQHELGRLILNMLAYLVFLVQFMNDGDAVAISVPFGCILGLLGSKTSTIMGVKRASRDPEAEEVGRRKFSK